MCVSRWNVTVLAAAGFLAAGLVAARGGAAAGEPAGGGRRDPGRFRGRPDELAAGVHRHDGAAAGPRAIASGGAWRAAVGAFPVRGRAGAAGSYVSKALPKVPVTADLSLSLYVRSNRTGAQLFGWVVLPADIDPDTKAPSYLLVPGTVFSRPDRWQKLELVDMLPAIEEQARVLRASSRRPVPLQGAYVERVVVNMMGGSGRDRGVPRRPRGRPRAAGVGGGLVRAAVARRGPGQGRDDRPTRRRRKDNRNCRRSGSNRSVFDKLTFERRYVGWFPTAIEAPGAEPSQLRQAGFDVLVTDANPDPEKLRRAVKAGDVPPAAVDGATQDGGVAAGARADGQISLAAVRRVVADRRSPGQRSRGGRAQGGGRQGPRRARGRARGRRAAPGHGDGGRRIPAVCALAFEPRRHRGRPADLGLVAVAVGRTDVPQAGAGT